MADSNSIVGSIGLDASAIVSALQQAVAQINATNTASTNLNVTVNNVTKATNTNATAVTQQTAALKQQAAQANLATAQSRAQAAQTNATTAAIRQQNAALTLQAKQAAAAARAARGGGGGAAGVPVDKTGMRIGQVGQQVQDVAVSLQGGMGLLQVAGQQLPQILGIFGTLGSVLGGVAAVTAATAYGINKVQEGFENFSDDVRTTNFELDRTIKFGNQVSTFASLGVASKQLSNINSELGKFDGFWGKFRVAAADIGGLFGGKNTLEQQRDLVIQAADTKTRIQKLENNSLTLSKEMLKVETLRAQGNDEQASKIEREIELKAKLGELSKQEGLSTPAKAQIAQDIVAAADVKEAYIEEARAAKIMGDAQAKQDKEQAKRDEDAAKRQHEHDAKQKEDFQAFEKERERVSKSVQKMLDEIDEAQNKIDKRRAKAAADQEKKQKKAADEEEKGRKKASEKADDVRVLEAEITSGDKAAKKLAERIKLENELRDAKNNHNQALQEQIEKEQKLVTVRDAIDEQLKSPQQKKAERDEERARRKAARIVESRARRIEQAAKNAGFGGEVKPADKAAGVPNLNPNAPAAGAAGAAAGNQMKVDTLVVKVLKHG